MLYDSVIKLYIALFARAPEKDSFTNWLKATIANQWDLGTLAQSMILAAREYLQAHPKDRAIYPQYADLDTHDLAKVRDVITSVYTILFNKSYQDDPQGIDTWVQSVLDGEPLGNVVASIVRVADGIAAGKIAADAATIAAARAFENKVAAAKYAIEKFPTFNGDFTLFQNIIKNVDTTQESLQEALAYINSFSQEDTTVLSREVQSLLIENGVRLPKDVITYSFDREMPAEYAQYPSLSNEWEPLDADDRAIAREVFAYVDSFLDVTFKEVPSDGDIRISKVTMSSSQEAGFTMEQLFDGHLVSYGVGADIFLAKDYDKELAAKDVMLHELGHALGLKHPFEQWPVMPAQKDNSLYTIMSYTERETYLPKVLLENYGDGYTYSVDVIPIGRQNYAIYDVEALRYLYGIQPTHLGDDRYDAGDVYNKHKFINIIDDGGIDWINFRSSQEPIRLFLEGGDHLSSVGEHLPWDIITDQIQDQMQEQQIDPIYFDQIYADVVRLINDNPDLKSMLYQGKGVMTFSQNSIENVIATAYDDTIYDNVLDNIILAGPGDDRIYLGSGNDYVDGGAGYDRVYISKSLGENFQEVTIGDTTYLVFDDKVIGLENIEEII